MSVTLAGATLTAIVAIVELVAALVVAAAIKLGVWDPHPVRTVRPAIEHSIRVATLRKTDMGIWFVRGGMITSLYP